MGGVRRNRDWAENGLSRRMAWSTDGCSSGLRSLGLDGVPRVSVVRLSPPQFRARSCFNVCTCSRTCTREFGNSSSSERSNVLVVGRVADSLCPRWHLGRQYLTLIESYRWCPVRCSSDFLAFCTLPSSPSQSELRRCVAKYPTPQMEGGGPSEGYALDIVNSLVPALDTPILPIQLRSILGPMHEYSMHPYNFSSSLPYHTPLRVPHVIRAD